MPETHQGYHLFQLCGKDTEEAIKFSEFRNDLGDGFRSQVLFGANTGLRRWNISFPSLAGSVSNTTITINGVAINPADYLWDLFCQTKVDGAPFVIQSKKNDQYYLAEFADDELSYKSIYAKLFTSGINLRQVRLPGVSVFDPMKRSWWGAYGSFLATDTSAGFDGSFWYDESGNGHTFSTGLSLDVILEENVQNGHDAIRLNSISGDSQLIYNVAGVQVQEIFFVMRMRESTFSNNAGILCPDVSGNDMLRGVTGQTKFKDEGYSSADPPKYFVYSKNGIKYAEANMQAPMNSFAVLYWRLEIGAGGMTGLQIGKDRGETDSYALMDAGDLYIATSPGSRSDALEMIEHLATDWDTH